MPYTAVHIYRNVCLRNGISPAEMLNILKYIEENGEVPEPYRGRRCFTYTLKLNGVISQKIPSARPRRWAPGPMFNQFKQYLCSAGN